MERERGEEGVFKSIEDIHIENKKKSKGVRREKRERESNHDITNSMSMSAFESPNEL